MFQGFPQHQAFPCSAVSPNTSFFTADSAEQLPSPFYDFPSWQFSLVNNGARFASCKPYSFSERESSLRDTGPRRAPLPKTRRLPQTNGLLGDQVRRNVFSLQIVFSGFPPPRLPLYSFEKEAPLTCCRPFSLLSQISGDTPPPSM